jgi:heavy metal sensor kinase
MNWFFVRWPRFKHIRTRLTLWYVAMLALLLALYGAGTVSLLVWNLNRQIGVRAIQDLETVEGLLYFAPGGQLRLHDDYHNHPESKRVQDRLLEVLSQDGGVLYRNDRLGDHSLGGAPFPGEGERGYSERSYRMDDGSRVRLVSRRHVEDGHVMLIRLAYSEEPVWQHLEVLVLVSLGCLPVALALAGFAGYGLARRALAPVEAMARQAEQITSERLSERLPGDHHDDELGYLARVFNNTLSRLEQSFEQLRRFTSDASHELRTPLAAIRGVGEVGLQKDRSPEEYRDAIGSMLEETTRLTQLVDGLLTISRADAGQIALQRTPVPVLGLMREATELLEVLMEEKRQRLVLTGDESATVLGDRLFLRQALVNLLHNAVKHSPVEGMISVFVRSQEGLISLEVIDSGPGIPLEHRNKIFDRFYRVDQSRSRDDGGAGLGLAIAKWAVEAHRGSVRVGSAKQGGSVFLIQLPAAGH